MIEFIYKFYCNRKKKGGYAIYKNYIFVLFVLIFVFNNSPFSKGKYVSGINQKEYSFDYVGMDSEKAVKQLEKMGYSIWRFDMDKQGGCL